MKITVFGDNPQINFVTIEYNKYDGIIKFYRISGTLSNYSFSIINSIPPISGSSIDSYFSFRINSIQFEFAGLYRSNSTIDVKIAEINYNKRSDFNKKPYMEKKSIEFFQQIFIKRIEKQFEKSQSISIVPQYPIPQNPGSGFQTQQFQILNQSQIDINPVFHFYQTPLSA